MMSIYPYPYLKNDLNHYRCRLSHSVPCTHIHTLEHYSIDHIKNQKHEGITTGKKLAGMPRRRNKKIVLLNRKIVALSFFGAPQRCPHQNFATYPYHHKNAPGDHHNARRTKNPKNYKRDLFKKEINFCKMGIFAKFKTVKHDR